MKTLIATISLLATACGTAEQPEVKPERVSELGGVKDRAPPASSKEWQSLQVADVSKLPECTPETAGRLAYVANEKAIYACVETVWEVVDLKGKDGKDGVSVKGVAGESIKGDKGDKGDAGEQGIQGLQGVAGIAGQQGVQGLQGVQGVAGTDGITTTITQSVSNLPRLVQADNKVIGDVVQYDGSLTSYLVNTAGGLRMRVSHQSQFRSSWQAFTTSDCSGTAYVLRTADLWEEVIAITNSPKVFKARTGNGLTINANSRKATDGSCAVWSSVNASVYLLRDLTDTELLDMPSGDLFIVD